jgi:hypothetical protein
MAVIPIKSFGGISPKVPARYLPDTSAQVASNCIVFNGSLQPLVGLGSTVATLTKVGTPLTIYRFGQDIISNSEYWFHWTTDVNVCRSQIPGDTSEWTFFTGDGAPKATYSTLALSGSNYPTVSRPLGLPAPTTTLVVTAATATVKATISTAAVSSIEVGDKVGVNLDGTNWSDITVTTATASAIAAQLTAITGVDATAVDGVIEVVRADPSDTDPFTVRYQTGSQPDTNGTFTYNSNLDKSDNGDANTSAYVIITDAEIGSVANGNVITVRTSAATQKTYTATGTFTSAATFAAAITSTGVVATVYGSCVVLTPGTAGGGPTDFIEYKRMDGATQVALQKVDGSEAAQPATVFVTATDMSYVAGKFAAITVNANSEVKVAVPAGSTVSALNVLASYGLSVTLHGVSEPFAEVRTSLVGSFSYIRLRAGDYGTKLIYAEIDSSTGTAIPETRVYTYTLVNKESGFDFESAPAPASTSIDVKVGQTVAVSNFDAIPSGYVATHRRIYRSVSGTFLFVAEITAATTSYTDSVLAEDLGEELPSLTWLPPPATLRGLTNLPNGIMAGFVGRDIYFCDPYRPHAWPVAYNQTIDFPVVGLGRMDTTLAVMTTGTPYFLQGSHPDSMVVVKSDLDQACASKRSIVSANGVVMYASPDGLVMLNSGGSKLVSEAAFTYAQWQALFNPSSIHAYMHDRKYVAFYDTGTTTGGFIYDLLTGQFTLHGVYATAGYTDLVNDKLFLAFADRTIKVWQAGTPLSYIWTSKKFTMPYEMAYSCSQVEAEAYPVTAKYYVNGSLVHTQTVTNRRPFRLPVIVGRDWEFRIEGNTEVFSVATAQSMQELAGV